MWNTNRVIRVTRLKKKNPTKRTRVACTALQQLSHTRDRGLMQALDVIALMIVAGVVYSRHCERQSLAEKARGVMFSSVNLQSRMPFV